MAFPPLFVALPFIFLRPFVDCLGVSAGMGRSCSTESVFFARCVCSLAGKVPCPFRADLFSIRLGVGHVISYFIAAWHFSLVGLRTDAVLPLVAESCISLPGAASRVGLLHAT